ncbi:MAG: hypothetical protein ACYS17_10480 [Planctomycetota bacterium]|jgi:hypothetical protein
MILFVVFFSIGAASLAISILCDDLVQYYRNKGQLTVTQQANDRFKSWIEDYDVLLEQREKDPNLVKRLAPAILGTEPEDANAVYPRATPEELAAARQALTQDPNDQSTAPMLPNWLTRCSEPRRRVTLFIAGSFLILISFTCFTPKRQSQAKKKR